MTSTSDFRPSSPAAFAVVGLTLGLPLILIASLFSLVILALGIVLAVIAVPVVIGVGLFRRYAVVAVPVPAARAAMETVIEIPGPARAPATVTQPVRVRVTRARGTCPTGRTFKVGTEYVFTNGHVDPELCPVAARAIRPLVEQMRRGEYPAVLKPQCISALHEVVFELEGIEERVETPAPA